MLTLVVEMNIIIKSQIVTFSSNQLVDQLGMKHDEPHSNHHRHHHHHNDQIGRREVLGPPTSSITMANLLEAIPPATLIVKMDIQVFIVIHHCHHNRHQHNHDHCHNHLRHHHHHHQASKPPGPSSFGYVNEYPLTSLKS